MKKQKNDKEKYVLDTSALICYLENEAGAEVVDNLLEKGEKQEARALHQSVPKVVDHLLRKTFANPS